MTKNMTTRSKKALSNSEIIDEAKKRIIESAIDFRNPPKLSHRKWRSVLKRERRRKRRKKAAKLRDSLEMESDPNVLYYENLIEQREVDEDIKRQRLSKFENEQWLLREKLASIEWKRKKQREEIERKNREQQERLIKEEWEKQQKLEKEEKERKEKEDKEIKEKQEALLKEATKNAKKEDDGTGSWHNPLAPVTYDKDVVQCPFFLKTGACRFKHHCSRAHITPEDSCTILFPHMYTHFSLDQALRDEYDTDIDLEYEDSETYRHFHDFYKDVLPEIRKHGRVLQFKVCRNYESHLRGNVYVQMSNQVETMKVFATFNGRWYGGRQISCQLCPVTNWKSAICGLYFRKKCPKGKHCNFLHVFLDPTDEFRQSNQNLDNADRSHRGNTDRSHRSNVDRSNRSNADRSHRGNADRSHRSRKSRSRSRERSTRRSRSRERSTRRSRSRERSTRRSRSRESSPRRERSRSPSFRRGRTRSPSKRRSRSPSRRSPSKSSRSPSRRRSRERSSKRKRSRSQPRKRSKQKLSPRNSGNENNSDQKLNQSLTDFNSNRSGTVDILPDLNGSKTYPTREGCDTPDRSKTPSVLEGGDTPDRSKTPPTLEGGDTPDRSKTPPILEDGDTPDSDVCKTPPVMVGSRSPSPETGRQN